MFTPDLVDDIARRRVVIFAGAGVSLSARTRTGERLRDWAGFLNYAVNSVQEGRDRDLTKRLIGDGDYLMACEVIKQVLDDNEWLNLLHHEFGKVAEPSELHKAIVDLNQRIIITTNFDKLFETTWKDAAPEATHHPQVINRLSADAFRLLRDDRDYLIKIHGTIDDPTEMIFSEGDYARFAFSNWAYSGFIEALLLTHTFIFVGFSMVDPAIRIALENDSQKYPKARPHYLFDGDVSEPRLAEISRRLRKLYIISYDPCSNHSQLPRMLRDLAVQGRSRRREQLAKEMALHLPESLKTQTRDRLD